MQNSPEKPKPRLGCAGIIRQGEGILMGIRNKPENRGLWVLPGGGIRFCESFEQTLRREIEAEAGIQITPGAFFRVYELINPPNEHRVIIYLHGTHLSGTPRHRPTSPRCAIFSQSKSRPLASKSKFRPWSSEFCVMPGYLPTTYPQRIRTKQPYELLGTSIRPAVEGH